METKNSASKHRATPELPTIVRKPLAWVPMPVATRVISNTLNVLFSEALAEGELEFLAQRVLNVFVSDAGLRFSVRLNGNKLCVGSEATVADVTIEGTVYTFLLLAARREDADTLFFQRQLKTSGDTELGLYIKNFLDGLDPESLPLHRSLGHILRGGIAVADGFDKIRSFGNAT